MLFYLTVLRIFDNNLILQEFLIHMDTSLSPNRIRSKRFINEKRIFFV